jgi:DNA-binding NarL/FixJ family response regulator
LTDPRLKTLSEQGGGCVIPGGNKLSVRIILADDHAMFREGLRLLLERAGIKVVGEAENGVELIDLARSLRPQVVITDMSMPLMNGIEAAATIRQELGIPSILLTMHTDPQYVLRAMSTGIVGYVLKSKASACLVEAVQEVARGNVYLSPGASNTVLRGMLAKSEIEEPLTARERQVLQLIAEGYTTKELAHFMTITVRTGESHRASLMDKLNIHNTAGLVRYALKQGLAQL